jgi:Rieske 2Fe-2S family protein
MSESSAGPPTRTSNVVTPTLATPTLERAAYTSPARFEQERERIFHRGWMFVCHTSAVPSGGRRVFDVVGESVIVTRDREGHVHAFANACRHRGAQLCEPHDVTMSPEACRAPSIQCPYHAWTYALDGRLLSTPRVDSGEIDRATNPLWSYRADEWNGMVFVSLDSAGASLREWLLAETPYVFEFENLRIADMIVAQRTVADVAANWKIIVENYQECLHCAVVHPELVEIVPLYQSGRVVDPDRADGAVQIVDGGNSFSPTGTEDLPTVPGIRPERVDLYRGTVVFPNLFLDITGTSISLTAMFPVAPDRTIVVGEYLFSPEVVDPNDPAVRDIVAFNELVGAQDYTVCEGVQRGVSSRSFTCGTLTSKDALVTDFNQHYRSHIDE